MLLPYGKKQAHLIHISEVESGTSELKCPYCEGELLAKKGKKMAHHFAHRSKSCWSSSTYDFFGLKQTVNLHTSLLDYAKKQHNETVAAIRKLEQQEVATHKKQEKIQQNIRKLIDSLNRLNLPEATRAVKQIKSYVHNEFEPLPDLTSIRHPTLFSYTDGTKKTHFKNLNKEQHKRFYPTHYHYPFLDLQNYHSNRYRLKEIADKRHLYQQDLASFQQFKIYFLKIEVGEKATFYKIGLSSRAIELRLAEIQSVLSTHFSNPIIEILYILENVAFLENFFKQKYRSKRYELSNFTEYFLFEPYEIEEINKNFDRILELNL